MTKTFLNIFTSLAFLLIFPCFAQAQNCLGDPDGTPCNDGNPATSFDTCYSGACQGSCGAPQVFCSQGEVCSLGVCRVTPESEQFFNNNLSQRWTELGPNLGGRLDAVFVRRDPNQQGGVQILVGSPGGGVWRLDSGQAKWQWNGNRGLADFHVAHIEKDLRDPNRLYLLTPSDLYASSDFGQTWSNLTGQGGHSGKVISPGGSYVGSKPFAQLACPDGTTRVFWGDPSGNGLWYSPQNGAPGTFKKTTLFSYQGIPGKETNFFLTLSNSVDQIVVDPVTGKIYLSRGSPTPDALFKSMDQCHWCQQECFDPQATITVSLDSANRTIFTSGLEPAGGGLPSPSTSNGLVWTGVADRLSTLVWSNNLSGMVLYSTVDGGRSWQQISGKIDGAWTQTRLFTWEGGNRLFADGFYPVTSNDPNDLGKTWNGYGVAHPDTRSYFVDLGLKKVWTVTDGAYADGSAGNIVEHEWPDLNTDPQNSHIISHDGLHVWQNFAVALTHLKGLSSAYRLFAASIDNGTACLDSQGSWVKANVAGGDSLSIMVHPYNQDRMYSISREDFSSTNNGASSGVCNQVRWTRSPIPANLEPLGSHSWGVNNMAIHPGEGMEDIVAFLAGYNHLVISNDGGKTWRDMPSSIRRNGFRYTSLVIDQGGWLYLGTTQGIYRCSKTLTLTNNDCGQLDPFGLVNQNSFGEVYSIRVTHPGSADPTYWAATSDGLYRKTPTENWKIVTGGEGYIVNEVETVPYAEHCLYAALGFDPQFLRHRGGLRFSTDNGNTWRTLTSDTDIHQVPIADIQADIYDPKRVFVATFGRGIWEYDWGGDFPAQCLFTCQTGKACNDGDSCTKGDTCDAQGQCVGTPVVPPQNQGPCTLQACNPLSGTYDAPDGTPCDDQSACTPTDVCTGLMCVGSRPITCNPFLDVCHEFDGHCDPQRGCVWTNKADGTPCNDHDICTQPDLCQSGRCQTTVVDTDNDGEPDCTDVCPSDRGKGKKEDITVCDCGKRQRKNSKTGKMECIDAGRFYYDVFVERILQLRKLPPPPPPHHSPFRWIR